jgi:hypothetical protein
MGILFENPRIVPIPKTRGSLSSYPSAEFDIGVAFRKFWFLPSHWWYLQEKRERCTTNRNLHSLFFGLSLEL